MMVYEPPTRLITPAIAKMELVPLGMSKYQTDAPLGYIINGYFEGLDDAGVDLSVFAVEQDIKRKLSSGELDLPEFLWTTLQNLSIREMAKVIYNMVLCDHMWHALHDDLTGQEYLGLPLVMSGEETFLTRLNEVTPILGRLGLDKGKTEGVVNGVKYPEVLKIFFSTRAQFFRVYHLGDFEGMARFVAEIEDRIGWPEELAGLFQDSRMLIRAIDQVERRFLSERLHPRLRRS